MTPRTRLAQARRVLRRMVEDETFVRRRVSEYSPEQQKLALKLHATTLEKQRAWVKELEDQLEN
jgi:hypothetical protein